MSQLPVSPHARMVGFAVLYGVSAFLSRLVIIDGESLSLIWPAAGVSAVWFLVQGGVRMLDLGTFALITGAVNYLTGASLSIALVLVVANVAQLIVFTTCIQRLRPELWGCGGTAGITTPRVLGGFMLASLVGAGVGVSCGVIGLFGVVGSVEPIQGAVWLGRNFCGLLVVGTFGHLLAHRVAFGRRTQQLGAAARGGPGEALALPGVTALLYTAAFMSDLPLVFPLLGVSVWVGMRFSTTAAAAHSLLCGSLAVWFTTIGEGPFAGLEPRVSALFIQAFVSVVVIAALAMATSRDERDRLANDLVESERAAASQAGLFEAVLESMSDGVYVVETGDHVVFENRAAARHLRGTQAVRGVDAPQLPASRPDGSAIDFEERPTSMALAGHVVQDFDLLLEPDGARRIMSISARPLQEKGENGATRALVVFRDVTQDRAERADLAAFAGVVAHDLRGPLQVINGWIEALDDELRNQVESGRPLDVQFARDTIGWAQSASERMGALIEDLLAHAMAGDKELEQNVVDLHDLVLEVGMCHGDAVIGTGGLPRVLADRGLVRQLFGNLFDNAIKYVAPGVTARLQVSAERVGDRVVIRIADNGVGVPVGQHDRIFQPFFRAHAAAYGGTGLGLAICQRIVERHGGSIAARDNPVGRGTVFEFSLPAAD